MKKPAIPIAPRIGDDRYRFDSALKENIEIITARRVAVLKPLLEAATTTEIINKVNELLARLQD